MDFNTPEAKQAEYAARAKLADTDLRTIKGLMIAGWPLLISTALVSFVHIFDTIQNSSMVGKLILPSGIVHTSNLAYTIIFDFVCIYVLTVHYMFKTAHLMNILVRWYFFFCIFALNMYSFNVHTPNMPSTYSEHIIPGMNILFSFLVPSIIPMSLWQIKVTQGVCREQYIETSVRVAVLRAQVAKGGASEYTRQDLANVLQISDPTTLTRTIQKLLSDGTLTKLGHGTYSGVL
jgi:glucan phosphoethanolaminetransferase (alkaline phosphatase superfamily)